jgi:hypothetical protein
VAIIKIDKSLTYRGDKSRAKYQSHKKFPEGKINTPRRRKIPVKKIYHIYAKDTCIFHSINEEEFQVTWNTLQRMVGIMKTEYSEGDLTYEELTVNKELDASY